MNPKYPVYIISKGRANSCLTARELKNYGRLKKSFMSKPKTKL